MLGQDDSDVYQTGYTVSANVEEPAGGVEQDSTGGWIQLIILAVILLSNYDLPKSKPAREYF